MGGKVNADTAYAVVKIAAAGGYFEGDIDTLDQHKLIEEAEFYVRHAKSAIDSGAGDDICTEIVELVGANARDDGYEPLPEEPQAEKRKPLATSDGLPLPRKIEGDPPEMPYDISACSDREVRRLASQFNACLTYTVRELSLIEIQEMRARQLLDAAHREAYIAEANAQNDSGGRVTKEALDLAAKQSPKYQELDAQRFELSVKAKETKALKEIYEANISRLSREATLRDDEFKRSGKR